ISTPSAVLEREQPFEHANRRVERRAHRAARCVLFARQFVFLNDRPDGATLAPPMRKLFDVLAEGLLSKNSRGDWTPLARIIQTPTAFRRRRRRRASLTEKMRG